jgi:hypothetical protein
LGLDAEHRQVVGTRHARASRPHPDRTPCDRRKTPWCRSRCAPALLRFGAVPTCPRGASEWKHRMLWNAVGSKHQGLARQRSYQPIGMGPSPSRNAGWIVHERSFADGYLDRSPRLDGDRVLLKRSTVQSHALPLHRPLLPCRGHSGCHRGHGRPSPWPLWLGPCSASSFLAAAMSFGGAPNARGENFRMPPKGSKAGSDQPT